MPKNQTTAKDSFSEAVKAGTRERREERALQRENRLLQAEYERDTRRNERREKARLSALQKEITTKVFPHIASVVRKVFGKSRRLKAKIATEPRSKETRLELTLHSYPGNRPDRKGWQNEAFWMTAFAQGGRLSLMTNGDHARPSDRGQTFHSTPEAVVGEAANMMTRYGTNVEVRALRRLTKKTPGR